MTKERPGKLSDAQYQDRLRQAQRERERDLADDLERLLAGEWGRRLAYWLVFEHGRLHGLSFDAGIRDGACAALHQAKAEGRREAAHELYAMLLDASPSGAVAMMSERTKRAVADMALENLAPPQEGA